MERRYQDVDRLNADKRNNESAQSIDEQIAAKKRGGRHRPVTDATQSERDQRNDNQSVEDDRREHSRLSVMKMHNVQRRQYWEYTCKHCRNNGEVLRYVI